MHLQTMLQHRKTLAIYHLLFTGCLGRTIAIQQKQHLHQQCRQLQLQLQSKHQHQLRPQLRLQPQQLQLHHSRSISVGMNLLDKVTVTFIRSNGDKIQATGKVGDSLLDVVIDNNIDLDGFGACEGTLTCSTCHLIFKESDYSKLPNKPSDEELDMLDLAYELTDTSRLGCQINLTKDMNGWEIHVPATINDVRNS